MFQCILKSWEFAYVFSHANLKETQHRDKIKRIICARVGITLVVIPYWWNRNIQSVAQTIQDARPDIPIPSSLLNGDFIPKEAPKGYSVIS